MNRRHNAEQNHQFHEVNLSRNIFISVFNGRDLFFPLLFLPAITAGKNLIRVKEKKTFPKIIRYYKWSPD